MHFRRSSTFLLIAFSLAPLIAGATAQETTAVEPAELVIEPAALELEVGESVALVARVLDAEGEQLDLPVLFYSGSRRDLLVSQDGQVEPRRHGQFEVIVIVPNRDRTGVLLQQRVAVTVDAPALDRIRIEGLPERVYVDSDYAFRVVLLDTAGNERTDEAIVWGGETTRYRQAGPASLRFIETGTVRVTLSAGGVGQTLDVQVRPNPIAGLRFDQTASAVRTGDVVRLVATPVDEAGASVADLPVTYSVAGTVAPEILAPGASAQVAADGRFVAEKPGTYTITAHAGGRAAATTISVAAREAARGIERVGHGPVRDRHTSDLWVWEGVDGGDYAITGTWGSDGSAYIWDVGDPTDMQIIQRVQIDARTVNDVKVSADGRIAVLSREGASNRRNGLVILDVSDPRSGVPVLSRFDDELTGGVHNVFIHDEHVYALSAGQRYDIINIEDPANPHRVGRFELDSPGHSIHDVWVRDGIAYSSNWSDGVVAVDVGGGGRGGSPRNPVELGRYAYPSGWNHAAYPYRSQSTGKFYVFAGDEAFPYGLNTGRGAAPTRAAGWIHVIEWDEWDAPREVARYEVPEAGTHNLWIEDDIMYVAYYNGGLRVVDVSGELMGDLYRQGREIARFLPDDPEGFSANAPMVWGPQPYKGLIFFSDWNSGLWAVRLSAPR